MHVNWYIATVPGMVAILGFAAGYGSLLNKVKQLQSDLRDRDAVVIRLGAKLESLNGHRLESLEKEVWSLRSWRHTIENTRLGRKMMGEDS